jgi:hypothetical protein
VINGGAGIRACLLYGIPESVIDVAGYIVVGVRDAGRAIVRVIGELRYAMRRRIRVVDVRGLSTRANRHIAMRITQGWQGGGHRKRGEGLCHAVCLACLGHSPGCGGLLMTCGCEKYGLDGSGWFLARILPCA